MSANQRLQDGSYRARIVRYPRVNGERAFFDASVTPASRELRVVAPGSARDYPLKTPGGFGFASLPATAAQVGNALMILSKDTLQREVFGFGSWNFLPQQTLSLGVGSPARAAEASRHSRIRASSATARGTHGSRSPAAPAPRAAPPPRTSTVISTS